MSSRTFSTALLVLAACSDLGGADQTLISCATNGGDSFARECTVEQETVEEGAILTIRHPDGGFRRLVVTTDGRGVAPADGAESATITLANDGMIDVQIGDARYRLPATVKATK